MGEQTFTEGLLALARREAATPEGRARVTRALREALREVEARSGVVLALDELSEHLVCAAEHLEYLREIMTQPPHPQG